jgi:hypothetical protein
MNIEIYLISRTLLNSSLSIIDALTGQIDVVERLIEELAFAREETQQLRTIPGSSYYSSVLIEGEVGAIDRFD